MTITNTEQTSASPTHAPAPVLAVDVVTDPSILARLPGFGRALESAGIGAITVTDGGLHPIHVAAHLAPVTERVSLLPRTDAVHVEPFHLATQLASLDHIAGGRSGWLLTAATDPAVPATVGRQQLDAAATAQEAADVVTASRLVWDSWAEDAVVQDAVRGMYVDASRLQYADFEGATFAVRGPAITPRSPQGLLPVLVADADRAIVGPRVHDELADGRVLDIDVSAAGDEAALADRVAVALRDAAPKSPDAVGPATIRLVRLVGLGVDLDDRAIAGLSALARSLQEAGLIAPAPTIGRSLREQLGLAPAEFQLDPARRGDRARLNHADAAQPAR